MSTIKILQITDLHIKPHHGETMLGIDTEVYFQQTLEYAFNQHGHFDLILLTGDLAQDPCADSYQRIYQYLVRYDTRCLCLPGNHDDFNLMNRYLNKNLISCDKQILLGNWQIITVNSQKPGKPGGEISQAELLFLEQALSSQPDLPALIALHHHCLTTGSKWLDTMQIQNSAEFLSLIESFPQVKVVTCGHVHQEFSRYHKHIALFATPASCFQFTPNSLEFSIDNAAPGYRLFNLFDDGRLTTQCHRLPIKLDNLNQNAQEY